MKTPTHIVIFNKSISVETYLLTDNVYSTEWYCNYTHTSIMPLSIEEAELYKIGDNKLLAYRYMGGRVTLRQGDSMKLTWIFKINRND